MPAPMDDLDRLAFRVARTVRTTYPHLLERGFTLADLEATLAPYAETRRELAIDGPHGYEHTLLRLLSGERGYLGTEPALQDACRRALTAPSPSVSLVRSWATAALTLNSGAFALADRSPHGAVGDAPRGTVPAIPATAQTHCDCHFCGGRLPTGRDVRFCPHCGLDLTVRHCPACSTELERPWRFCVTCGREAEADAAGLAARAQPA
jgi:hypothetical protein